MVKIFIDPGHGGTDPGAVANGIQEKDITLGISLRVRDILLSDYEDVSILMSRTEDQTVSLDSRTNAANNWGADYYVSVHINSGGGTGFESFVYPRAPQRTISFQKFVHQHIIEQVSFANRGMKQADFHVLRETRMDAILTENGFIDNITDAVSLKDERFIEQLAEGHARGIAAAFQLQRKQQLSERFSGSTQIQESEQTEQLFTVQIGSFKDQSNAEQIALQAKEKGFHTFIKQRDEFFRVQIGAYKERNNAEELVQQAKDAGFPATIVITAGL